MFRKSLKRITITYGILIALCCIAFFIALYFITPNPLGQRRPDIGFHVILIFAALYRFKRSTGGYLHFYEGVTIGFLANLLAAFITGVFLYIFVKFIDYQPFATWLQEAKNLLNSQKETFSRILDETNYKRQLDSLTNAKPYQLILDELMFKQMSIIPITLLTMVLRRQRPNS